MQYLLLTSFGLVQTRKIVTSIFKGTACANTPYSVTFKQSTDSECSASAVSCTKSDLVSYKIECAEDDYSPKNQFGTSSFILFKTFSDDACLSLSAGEATLADGSCLPDITTKTSARLTKNANQTVTHLEFLSTNCTGDFTSLTYANDQLNGGCSTGNTRLSSAGVNDGSRVSASINLQPGIVMIISLGISMLF